MRLYYGGLVIHQSQSDDGVIEVVDLDDMRSMHFGSHPRQSSMSLATPHTLELTYTQSMMACLLLNPEPERVLVVGLGGGSLVKFILHHFPHCHIDVIEYREDVVKVAHGYFKVPSDEPRLTIHLGDGYLFTQDRFFQSDTNYDLILVDAYDHTGMAASVGVQAFFDACAGILSPDGVMSVNLWGSDNALFGQTMSRINQSFDGRTMILPVENKGNVIGLAMNKLVTNAALKKLKPQVELQELKFNINLPRALHDLIRQNRSLISRLFS
ncbi:spermidine synthase [Methylophaga sp. 42_25_T18]|nr:spermidine synthase [Methylophaga sp. 42_25_T18]OUR89951.1 spermidine synthase [Methylophaga sp. 42_8_T64]